MSPRPSHAPDARCSCSLFFFFFFICFFFFSQTPFDSWLYSSTNWFLLLPIIILGLLERDLSDGSVLKDPRVYETGRKNMDIGMLKMFLWICNAVISVFIAFLLPWLAMTGRDFGTMGGTPGVSDHVGCVLVPFFQPQICFALRSKVTLLPSLSPPLPPLSLYSSCTSLHLCLPLLPPHQSLGLWINSLCRSCQRNARALCARDDDVDVPPGCCVLRQPRKSCAYVLAAPLL